MNIHAGEETLSHLIDLYVNHKLALSADHTRYRYTHALNLFREFLKREPLLTDLRDVVVTRAIGWIMRGRGLSAGSASKFRDCILAVWRYGARKGLVKDDSGAILFPDVVDVREPRRIPIAWTMGQLGTLWRYLERMPGELDGIPASDWFCSLHAVIWDTGERIGALRKTELKQIDFDGGWIVVRAEVRKGRLADKLSKLHPATVELLKRIRFPERKLVWPWPYSPLYLWRVYGDILQRAGLPNGRDRKFHCIRKSVATHITALSGLGDAQSALGHASGELTRDVYVDPTIAKGVFPADILPRLDGEGPRAA